jgi:hypothetical protein
MDSKRGEEAAAAVSSSAGKAQTKRQHQHIQEKTAEKSQVTQEDIKDDWGYDVHSAFVKAIFEEGLKACSPSVLIEQMQVKTDVITSER